jgi:hypothetical protein
MSTPDMSGRWRRVRVWLGEHLIAEYVAEPARAARYRQVMTPRFSGLLITIEPLSADPVREGGEGLESSAARLPDEQLWSLTVQ